MTSFTFSDHKTGGRITAAVDAIAAGKLRTAAGIFLELGNELNIEAMDGLLSEDEDSTEWPIKPVEQPMHQMAVKGQPVDTQSCARNVHQYGATDSNGWRTCAACGYVNVAPPENNGPYDMGARQ